MSGVAPVERQVRVGARPGEVLPRVMASLKGLRGKIKECDETRVVCNFGSLLRSRLLGEFWVSKATLPKRAIIRLSEAQAGGTTVSVYVQDTHRFGFKWGYVKKYEEALAEVADSIVSAVQS